ncbi:MAG: 6-phosphofructokinase [Bacteroidia bacterium]
MDKIAVFTSGGDSPGMNACIRAVVRKALHEGVEVFGIMRGYQGMIEGDIIPMYSNSVSNIIQRGGTILKSARSKEFMTVEGRKKAHESLKKHGITHVVAIGGDGTFTGASVFMKEFSGVDFIGIPGTIDNDLYGTDNCIGYDTALNTVVDAVDKIRDTAASHDRLFIVEVMGKDAGFIALRSGIAVGAEAILVPETPTYTNALIEKLRKGLRNNKMSSIIIVAEGDDSGGAYEVQKHIQQHFDCFDTRVSILGHIQRGGSPSAQDRVLASRMGVAAVEALLVGRKNEMVGIVNNQIQYTPFEQSVKHHLSINRSLLDLAEVLSH